MPNKKNNIPFRGSKKLSLNTPKSSSDFKTDLNQQINNLRDLQEIFGSSVDLEIIQAVLEECDGNMSDSTEKLFDILNESKFNNSTAPMEQTDLALIACSLLSEETSEVQDLKDETFKLKTTPEEHSPGLQNVDSYVVKHQQLTASDNLFDHRQPDLIPDSLSNLNDALWNGFYAELDQLIEPEQQNDSGNSIAQVDCFIMNPKQQSENSDAAFSNISGAPAFQTDFQRKRSETESSQSAVSYDSTSSTEESIEKKTFGPLSHSKLSPSALEFIPRPVAKKHPISGGQQKKLSFLNSVTKPVAVDCPQSQNTQAGPENQAAGKKSRGKRKNKRSTAIPGFQNGQHSISNYAETNSQPLTQLNNSFDPFDPLGWNDIYTTESLVDPKPQRSQRGKKHGTVSQTQQNTSSSSVSADISVVQAAFRTKGVKYSSCPNTRNNSQPLQNTDSDYQKTFLSFNSSQHLQNTGNDYEKTFPSFNSSQPLQNTGSDYEKTFPSFNRSQPLQNTGSDYEKTFPRFSSVYGLGLNSSSAISSRLPPSLIGHSSSLTKSQVTSDRSQELAKITSVASLPKDDLKVKTAPAQSQGIPKFTVEPELVRNKLIFQRVTSPVGIIKLYVSERQPVMVILRGLPGSGKSYLANQLQQVSETMGVKGKILSTDDYFMQRGEYHFDRDDLGTAHDWNKTRALQCVKEDVSPIFIDNTNTTLWELLPYAEIALQHRYDVQLFEPDTQWKNKVPELARLNSHNVSYEHIRRMKDRFEKLTTEDVLRHASKALSARNSSHVGSSKSTTDQEPMSQRTVQKSEMPPKQQNPSHLGIQHKALGTEQPKSVKQTDNKSQTSNTQQAQFGLGLSDWFDLDTAHHKGSSETKGKSSLTGRKVKKAKPMEITNEFLNQSLKKAMVNIMNAGLEKQCPVTESSQTISAGGNKVEDIVRLTSSFFEGGVTEYTGETAEVNKSFKPQETFQNKKEKTVLQLENTCSTSDAHQSYFSNVDKVHRRDISGGDGRVEHVEGVCDLMSDGLVTEKRSSPLSLQAFNKHGVSLANTSGTLNEPTCFKPLGGMSDIPVANGGKDRSNVETSCVEKITFSTGEENLNESSTKLYVGQGVIEKNKDSDTFFSKMDTYCKLVLEKTICSDNNLQALKSTEFTQSSNMSSLVAYSDSASSDCEKNLTMKDQAICPTGKQDVESSTDEEDLRPCSSPKNAVTSSGKAIEAKLCQDEKAFPGKAEDLAQGTSEEGLTQSSESSVISSREQSPRIAGPATGTSPMSKKSHKKKKAKKGQNIGPFIDEGLKVKSKTESWNLFLVQSLENNKLHDVQVSTEGACSVTEKVSAGTLIDSYYFSIVYKLNSTSFNDLQPLDLSFSDEKVLSSSSQTVMAARWGNSSESDLNIPKSCGTIDRSTSTDEALEKEEIDFETLQKCFPEYSKRQLEEVMAVCQNNLEWVSYHLLETPALFDMEDEGDEDSQIYGGNAKIMPAPSQEPSPSPVSSLANMCRSVVKKSQLVDADDLEMHVIKAGEERLNRIERFGRSRLHSVSEEEFRADYWPDDFCLYDFSGTVQNVHSLPSDVQLRTNEDFAKQNDLSPDGDNFLSNLMEKDIILKEYNSTPEVTSVSPRSAKTKPDQPVLPVDFVRCLESLYGSLNLPLDDEGLILDDHTARKIYNCLKLQGANKTIAMSKDYQLQADEEYAKTLQEMEYSQQDSQTSSATNFSKSTSKGQSSVPGWTSQNPSWMTGGVSDASAKFREHPLNNKISSANLVSSKTHSLSNTVSDTLHQLRGTVGSPLTPIKFHNRMPKMKPKVQSAWAGAKRKWQVDSLQSIMEEEQRQERLQKEQAEKRQMAGATNDISTKIKRAELTQLFPTLGPGFLEEVFRDNDYKLDRTIKTLETTYNLQRVSLPQDKQEEIWPQGMVKNGYGQSIQADEEEELFDENMDPYSALRNEAQMYHALAKEAQQQAQRYHADGMAAAALVFRQRVKKYKEEQAEANMRAADILYRKGYERLEKENTLDLHFYHLDEAIGAVNKAIDEKEAVYKVKPEKKNSYLNIVTGRGRNSRNGIPRLKPAIMNHLRDKCLRFEDKSPGMLRVHLGQRL